RAPGKYALLVAQGFLPRAVSDTPSLKPGQPEARLVQPLLLAPLSGCGEDSTLATRSDPRSARIPADLDTRRTISGSNCRPAYFSSSSIAVASGRAFR